MSDHDDQRLRDAFGRIQGENGAPVDPDELWEAVRGDGNPEAVAALAERLGVDPQLREEWAIAAAFAAEEERADQDAPSETVEQSSDAAANTGQYRWWLGIGVAAAAMLIALMVWPEPEQVQYQPDGRVRTGASADLRSKVDGPLSKASPVLQWTAVEDAVRYEVHVTTDDLEPVFDAVDLKETSVTIDAQRLSTLPLGTTLLWRVEAWKPDGTRRRSETFTAVLVTP